MFRGLYKAESSWYNPHTPDKSGSKNSKSVSYFYSTADERYPVKVIKIDFVYIPSKARADDNFYHVRDNEMFDRVKISLDNKPVDTFTCAVEDPYKTSHKTVIDSVECIWRAGEYFNTATLFFEPMNMYEPGTDLQEYKNKILEKAVQSANFFATGIGLNFTLPFLENGSASFLYQPTHEPVYHTNQYVVQVNNTPSNIGSIPINDIYAISPKLGQIKQVISENMHFNDYSVGDAPKKFTQSTSSLNRIQINRGESSHASYRKVYGTELFVEYSSPNPETPIDKMNMKITQSDEIEAMKKLSYIKRSHSFSSAFVNKEIFVSDINDKLFCSEYNKKQINCDWYFEEFSLSFALSGYEPHRQHDAVEYFWDYIGGAVVDIIHPRGNTYTDQSISYSAPSNPILQNTSLYRHTPRDEITRPTLNSRRSIIRPVLQEQELPDIYIPEVYITEGTNGPTGFKQLKADVCNAGGDMRSGKFVVQMSMPLDFLETPQMFTTIILTPSDPLRKGECRSVALYSFGVQHQAGLDEILPHSPGGVPVRVMANVGDFQFSRHNPLVVSTLQNWSEPIPEMTHDNNYWVGVVPVYNY